MSFDATQVMEDSAVGSVRHDRLFLGAHLVGFYLVGLSLSLLGPSLLDIRERTGATIAQSGLLVVAQAGGAILGSILAGPLVDRLHGHRVMVFAQIMVVASWAIAGQVTSLVGLAAVMACVGFCASTLNVGSNTLAVWHLAAGKGGSISVLHLGFALGALTAPALAVSGMAIPVLVVACVVSAGGLIAVAPPTPASAPSVGGDRVGVVALVILASFFAMIVAIEVTVGSWLPTYGVEQGMTDVAAAGLTTVFWVGFVLGRLISAALDRRIAPRPVIFVSIAAIALGAVGMIVSGGSGLWLWCAAGLVGAGLSPLFPQMLNYVGRRIAVSGSVTSWLITGAGVGGLVFPWGIGQWLGHSGAEAVPWSLALLVLLLSAALFGAERVLAAPSTSTDSTERT